MTPAKLAALDAVARGWVFEDSGRVRIVKPGRGLRPKLPRAGTLHSLLMSGYLNGTYDEVGDLTYFITPSGRRLLTMWLPAV